MYTTSTSCTNRIRIVIPLAGRMTIQLLNVTVKLNTMNFLSNILDAIKQRYIKRLWIAAIGTATSASVYLAGVVQTAIMSKAPMLVSHVAGDALASVIVGVLVSLITWGFSKWLGKPIALLQAEFGLEQTGLLGDKTAEAITDAINCPHTYAMRTDDGIQIRKPRIINE